MIIKYNSNGETEWARVIESNGNTEINSVALTSDGGIIVGGYGDEEHNGSTTYSSSGILVKYSSNGNEEWNKKVASDGKAKINSVQPTKDGGYIVGGSFETENIDLGDGVSITAKKTEKNGMVIKYSSDGKAEWAQGIGGEKTYNSDSRDEVISVKEKNDGSYIVGGRFESQSIDLGNGVKLTKSSEYATDFNGMLIAYTKDGKAKWAQRIGGSTGDDYSGVYAVSSTSDGGFIVGGYVGGYLGNGYIIKYNAREKKEWSNYIEGGGIITAVTELSNGNYSAGGYFKGSTIKVDGKILTNKADIADRNLTTDGFALKITNAIGVSEIQELEVENKRKEYKITTDVKEIDNIKGGTISGEDEREYEVVKYGDSSTKEIKMIPDENYEIIGITVNDKDYSFVANADGSYTMPAFTNMTEDKRVVVTYSLKNNKITINKVDKNTKEKLTGATFRLDQIEERSEPNNNEIIGELTDNGQRYINYLGLSDEVTDRFGKLTNNGTYYFVQNEEGTYTPTNSKTYQVANGGTAGIQSSTANSYITIDLSEMTGKYVVEINASCSSEGSDKGYATITETTTAPSYSSSTGRFMYVSGTSDAKDYTSAVLEGGKTYYLHLGYRKDSSVDSNNDQVVINSIKLYKANTETFTYNFINNNGKYESTNQGKDSTVANSYIPIDLTNYTGKYNLTVNAEISSENYSDVGYVTVTENTTRPSYNSSTGRFVYIYGTQNAQDYTTVLQGGKMYYLHLGYYKNASTSSGDDKFTVNSVNITLNDSELYHTTVETNSFGQAITQIPFGKYSITETKVPDGYWLNEMPTIVEFRSTEGSIHEFTIEDEAKAKLTVHHYIKGTTTKLAEDEYSEAHAGDSYTTSPKIDLNKYELEKDENGNLVLPDNVIGTYAEEPTEVTYYYVEKKIPLTVHHYIEGTTTQVPLKDGSLAEDRVDNGVEGEAYTTSPILDEELNDEYELAEIPDNASGTYSGNEIIVTYYYKKVSRTVNLIKYQQDGKTPLQGVKFNVIEKRDDIVIDEVKSDGTYYFTNSNGKYISNNQNESDTTAKSYMKIDTTNAVKDITVTVNAEISSENYYDVGYATITQTETAPSYNSSVGNFVYISGIQSAKDYSITLEKGKVYYLHLGYRKDSSANSGTDTFIINSIDVGNVERHITNEQGKIQTDLEIGKYEVTEIEAPEGYKLPDNPTTEVTITKATTSEDLEITNEKKTGTVIVHHYIEGTTTPVPLADGSVAQDETKTGNVGNMYATTARTDISESYELVAEPENASGNYIDGNIEVIYYYKAIPASVIVHHYLEGTTTKLADDVTFNGVVGDNYTTGVGNVDNKYEVVAIPANANGKMTRETIEVIYYYRLKNTSVLVHHYIKDTTTSLSDDVTINGKIDDEYKTTIANDIPEQYELVAEPDNKEGIMTKEQIVVTYYYQLKNYPYVVNYLEKGTDNVLHEAKQGDELVYGSTVNSVDEKIDIDGYKFDSFDKDVLTIGTVNNVINIYYTKRADLSYKVNYLEKGTNNVIHEQKVQGGMIFDSEVTSSDEVIDINGYNYDSVDKDTLKITTGENVINIYYTKVSGLSYTVNYLEKDTNEVLQAPKTTGEMTFEAEITSSDEVIEIDGYNYDSIDKEKLIIGTGENVINIYYTKRNDLSYKVNYLEKTTNKVIHDPKVQEGMIFEDVVTSSNEIIDIDGYNYDSVDKDSLTITTGENVINIYYTKKDAKVTVHYYEEGTTNRVSDDVEITGKVSDNYETESASDIPSKYELVVEPENKNGTMTEDEITVIYYYRKKATQVIVHYYEEGTVKKLSEDVTINGRVDDSYTTVNATDVPIKYELVAVPDNASGMMTEDTIEVIYYYRKKATQVIVHYYEEGTVKKLSEDVTINGRVDDSYTTVNATDVPIKYELVAVPDNASGMMTEDTIEVIYYYRVKDAVVNVRYLEKGTNIELANSDRLNGKVEDDYQTSAKNIDGYQLVEHTGNERGKFEVEPLTITYYYLYKTKATVQYIDKTTGAILEQSTTEGLEGDEFETESKDFENYVLVEEPAEKTVKMTKEEQVLKYYYIHVSGGVIEKHIDVISGQILANAVHNGNEGDAYDIPSRTFDGYDLVEDRLPANSKGTMKVDPVEVVYYYSYRTKVTAEYIDKNTGNRLTDDVVQNGHEGDNYTTERKLFDGYKLIEVPANADGTMTKDDIKVTYYYVHTSGGVIVNHLDVKTNKQLIDETKEEGYEGDPYETHEENISGYDLVKEKYPENATGTMTTETIRVTYYYIKKTEVNVKYVDKETGEEIDVPTNIPGHEGDDYKTETKDVPGYDLVEEPENKDGTMTANPIDVIYYYRRPAKVIVNYYDADTKEKLADEVEITGHQNDEYTTEQKDIKYYKIETLPVNKDGKMIVTVTKDENGKKIVEDTTYVNYYYRKLIFNLRVDKTIASVIVNGQETAINGNLGKVEVHRKELSTANVKVVYKIKVTNDSELTGKANVVENIPSGMTMKLDNNPGWTINETTASIETDEIKPGESREYQVVLGWQNGDSNIGTKENVASIVTENEAGFEEQFDTDNVSRANLIVAVGTGEVPYVAIAGGILMIMIAMTVGVYVIKKRK